MYHHVCFCFTFSGRIIELDMNEFGTVQAWLRNTYNIGVSAEWLTACLEWIQHENEGQQQSTDNLISQVYEQWLMSDLSEIAEPVLPEDVATAEKMELISNYPLQVISVVDAGFPLYGQKQKLMGRDNPNDEVSADKPFQPAWEPKPSRMLILQLTDGYTQVQAMEYQQIRDLHVNIPSGMKLLLCGRMQCRRGMILLTSESVQALGGEVDALAEQNTMLANLEQAMEKNRLDEGNHAKKEFSGRFITRGSDKKLDSMDQSCMKKPKLSHVKREVKTEVKPDVRSHQELLPMRNASSGNTYQSQHSVKKETFSSSSSSTYGRSKEDIKNVLKGTWSSTHVNPSTSGQTSGRAVSSSETDDFFDDEMDLEELDAIESFMSQENPTDSNTNRPLTTSLPKNMMNTASDISYSQRGSNQDHCRRDENESFSTARKMVTDTYVSIGQGRGGGNNSCSKDKVSTTEDDNDDLFDDDFEIDKIADPTLPCVRDSQKSLASSPTFGFQGQTSVGSIVKTEASAPSIPLSTKQLCKQETKAPLFKTKSSPGRTFVRQNSSNQQQSMRQSKLSDMFSKNTSRNKGLPSVKSGEFTNQPDSYSCDSFKHSPETDTRTNREAQHADVKLCRDQGKDTRGQFESLCHQKILPKAVIHPFSSGDDSKDNGVYDEKAPYIYLSQLANIQLPALVTVKAYIFTLTDKLASCGGARWSLSCRINDGTACVDVELADKVLTQLIGFSAKDSVVMRQRMKTDPEVKEVLMEGLSQCQQKLINISCLMEVEVVSRTAKPTVHKFTPLAKDHVVQLLSRVEKSLALSTQ